MSMPANGGNQQGAGQQAQQDPNGGAGQQAGQQPGGGDGSLIAAAAEGQQGQADQGQQAGGGQQQGAPTLESIAAQLAAMPSQFQSELDRRINQAVSTLDRRYGGQGQQQAPGGQQQDQDQGQQSGQRDGQGRFVQHPAGPDPHDLREARTVCRDALNDGIKFLDPVERQLAMSIAQPELEQRLADGASVDAAGAAAAAEALGQIRKLRGTYERATLSALEAQGRLVRAPGTEQRLAGMPMSTVPTGQPNHVGAYQQGAAMAAQVLPGRVRQQQGQQR